MEGAERYFTRPAALQKWITKLNSTNIAEYVLDSTRESSTNICSKFRDSLLQTFEIDVGKDRSLSTLCNTCYAKMRQQILKTDQSLVHQKSNSGHHILMGNFSLKYSSELDASNWRNMHKQWPTSLEWHFSYSPRAITNSTRRRV